MGIKKNLMLKMSSLNICFGDEIQLKDNSGDHDGKDIDNRQCFKCPSKHGIFVERPQIIHIIKKHTVSASAFSYNQCVQLVKFQKLRGKIKYIGFTHFDSNYWYGIELESKKNNRCISYLRKNEQNIYFNAERNKSIFVRSNQIRSIANSKNSIQPIAILQAEDDEDVINQSMLSMMNTLNIPQNARSDMFNMDKSKKFTNQTMVSDQTKFCQINSTKIECS